MDPTLDSDIDDNFKGALDADYIAAAEGRLSNVKITRQCKPGTHAMQRQPRLKVSVAYSVPTTAQVSDQGGIFHILDPKVGNSNDSHRWYPIKTTFRLYATYHRLLVVPPPESRSIRRIDET